MYCTKTYSKSQGHLKVKAKDIQVKSNTKNFVSVFLLFAKRVFSVLVCLSVCLSVSTRLGVPLVKVGTPQGRYLPHQETEQHSEYLLRSRRYLSCVHVGGISCLKCVNQRKMTSIFIADEKETNFSYNSISSFTSQWSRQNINRIQEYFLITHYTYFESSFQIMRYDQEM